MIVYHGTSPVLAPTIAREGLKPQTAGYVHLSSTPGLAWAYGAWAQGLVLAAGYTDGPPAAFEDLARIAAGDVEPLQTIRRVFGEHGPGFAAVAKIETLSPLDADPQTACPNLPWEDEMRVAPCYRTTRPIPPSAIVEWRLHRVPELDDPDTLAAMTGQAGRIAEEWPRGHAILEDLSPDPIGREIPNRRRLVAAILDAAGDAASLDGHGTAHWTRVAAHGLDLDPDADPLVGLLFALLHDAPRSGDGRDDDHATRAVDLARRPNGHVFTLDPARLEVLCDALARHDEGETSDDPAIGACWDADRLDLVRYGLRVRPDLMSTAEGRQRAAEAAPLSQPTLPDVLDEYAARLAA